MTLTTIFHVFGVRINRYKLIKHIVANVSSFPSLIQDAILDVLRDKYLPYFRFVNIWRSI